MRQVAASAWLQTPYVAAGLKHRRWTAKGSPALVGSSFTLTVRSVDEAVNGCMMDDRFIEAHDSASRTVVVVLVSRRSRSGQSCAGWDP